MSDDPSDRTGESTGSAKGSAGEKLSVFSMALWGPGGPPEDRVRQERSVVVLCRGRWAR